MPLVDFISSLSFYVIPYFTGRVFTNTFIHPVYKGFKRCFFEWLLGCAFWFSYFYLTTLFLSLLDVRHLLGNIILSSVVLVIISNLLIVFSKRNTLYLDLKESYIKAKTTDGLIPTTMPLISLAVFSTLVYFFIWRVQTPYPFQVNWDIYEHITLSNKILEGYLNFLPSQISDTFTFNGYSPLFHILLSLPKAVFKTDLLGVYWYLEYWHYLLVVLAGYLLARSISQNRWLPVISALLSGLIFESSLVYSSLFLIPQTLSGLITAFGFHLILGRTEWSKEKTAVILLILVIFLLHFIVGIIGALIILALVILNHSNSQSPKCRKFIEVFAYLSVLFLSLAVISHFFGSWSLTAREEAMHINFSLRKKIELFTDWYSLVLPVFLPVGFWSVIRAKRPNQLFVLAVGFFTLGLSILPVSYFLKFFVVSRYFINLVISIGIVASVMFLSKLLRTIILIWLSVAMLITFYNNQSFYKEHLTSRGIQSHISKAEIDAGIWLSYNFGNNMLLISDPSTQYIIEAISGVNSQGGAYMDNQTRRSLSKIDKSQDTQMAIHLLQSIEDKLDYEKSKNTRRIFIAGGRYFAWQKMPERWKESFFYNVWEPHKIELIDQPYINHLTGNGIFKTLYQNDELVILEL